MLQRRSLLAGFGLALAAPAIIRTPGLLMPVRAMRGEDIWRLEYTDGGLRALNAAGRIVWTIRGSGTFSLPRGASGLYIATLAAGGGGGIARA